MELKDILELVKDDNVYIGLSYIGQNDYTISSKKSLLEETSLLESKVQSINAFKNKARRIVAIKIFKNFE